MVLRLTAMCGVSATLAVVAFIGACQPALAADRSWRDNLFGVAPPPDDRSADAPLVAHYEADEGAAFVLDRSIGRPTLMRFDGNPEIWALRPSPGPRGDIIYKNDMGEPMLRATRLGGLTLFTPGRPGGSAAAMAGPAPALRPMVVNSVTGLAQVLAQASVRAGHAVQHQMRFDVPSTDDTPATLSLFADAARVTAKAFVEVAGSGPSGQTDAARFDKVTFDQAKKVDVRTRGETVQITVAPSEGLMGRPSSGWIAKALTRK